MYYTHFGLSKPPFKITPDTTLFYSGAERGSVLDALNYVVLSGEGITKVIGEVGAGKTMLCRMLEEKLPDSVETIYIGNPSISAENILNVIGFEVGLIQQPQSKLEVMQLLQQWLLEKYSADRQVVVLIEEAQNMPLETLEEIRLLSNLETDQHKLLQIVLFGQPELDSKLSDNAIRQLKERIAHNFYLNPLTRTQIKDYLNFRMRNAGYHGPDIFDEKTSAAIARHSKGLIRRINILADKSLIAAYAEGTTLLNVKHVRKAAKDSQFSKIRPVSRQTLFGALIGLTAGALLVSVTWTLTARDKKPYYPELGQINNAINITTPAADATTETESSISTEEIAEPEQTQPTKENLDIAATSHSISPEKTPDPIVSTPPEIAAPTQEIVENNSFEPAEAELLPASALQSRIVVTRDWLHHSNPRQYSIQLMMLSASSSERLNDYLKDLPKTVDIKDIFVYEAIVDGKNMLGVLYQLFGSRAEALAKLENMPYAFERFRPFMIRSIRGLRKETNADKQLSHANIKL